MTEYKVKVYQNKTEWYNSKDQLHRLDGPAIEWADGDKWWYLNGQLHREDGPAVEWANGDKSWYLNGKELTDLYFLERNKVELTLEEIADKFNIDINQLKIKK